MVHRDDLYGVVCYVYVCHDSHSDCELDLAGGYCDADYEDHGLDDDHAYGDHNHDPAHDDVDYDDDADDDADDGDLECSQHVVHSAETV